MGYLKTLLGVILLGVSAMAGALEAVSAAPVAHAAQAMLLGAAWAQKRVVAVGDHGIVLLSDDHGRSYRQARAVPVSSSLTGVSFADARHGWAVGHWGRLLPATMAASIGRFSA